MTFGGFSAGAYAARDNKCIFTPLRINRRPLKKNDVHISIKYCGICHSDIHIVNGAWSKTYYPIVPGHEIAGIVEAAGCDVRKYKKGDKVAVGCLVDSCRKCENCLESEAQYCLNDLTLTYNSPDGDGGITYGGYSTDIVVDEDFVFRVPDNLDLASAAPLLCAGVTTYSPLVRHGLQRGGYKLGVIGLGGLGHMAVKLGKAFGNEVTVISTSESKKQDAESKLGAANFILSTNEAQMKASMSTLDFILDTAAQEKDMEPYMRLLKTHGVLITVGAPPAGSKISISPSTLISAGRSITGSDIGSLKEHQEMLDFCGAHDIVADIELVKCDQIEEAFRRVQKGNVKYRFVLDIDSSCPKADACPAE